MNEKDNLLRLITNEEYDEKLKILEELSKKEGLEGKF